MKNIILVDLKSVISTGAYQQNLGELRNLKTGVYTGGAMYFLNTLSREIRRVFQQTGIQPFVVVCDDRRHQDTGKYMRDSISEKLLGGSVYKKDRTPQDSDNRKKREDSEKLVYQFIQDCTVLGNVFRVEGYEADDLIANQIKQLEFEQALIMSHDSDLDCLLQGKRVRRTRRASTDNTGYYTESDLLNDKGLKPEQVQMYNAISGGHNNIPRIKKYGARNAIAEKGAIKLLLGTSPLHEALGYECHHPFDVDQTINGFDLLKVNMQLCRLPLHDGLPVFDVSDYETDPIPEASEIGSYFTNHIGMGDDRALELTMLFNEFNMYWRSQTPQADSAKSDLAKFLGAPSV